LLEGFNDEVLKFLVHTFRSLINVEDDHPHGLSSSNTFWRATPEQQAVVSAQAGCEFSGNKFPLAGN
jgi:hypothetical protein